MGLAHRVWSPQTTCSAGFAGKQTLVGTWTWHVAGRKNEILNFSIHVTLLSKRSQRHMPRTHCATADIWTQSPRRNFCLQCILHLRSVRKLSRRPSVCPKGLCTDLSHKLRRKSGVSALCASARLLRPFSEIAGKDL